MLPSVLLCDDHVLLLEALVGILFAHEFSDVQAVTSPSAALSLLDARSFQVCLLDIAFPNEDGLTALREFRRIRPEMKVLVLSATRDRRIVAEVLMEGALGFVGRMLRLRRSWRPSIGLPEVGGPWTRRSCATWCMTSGSRWLQPTP